FKIGMKFIGYNSILSGSPDQQLFTTRNLTFRKQPFVGIIRIIRNKISGEVDGCAGRIVELDPVFGVAVVIRYFSRVGRTYFVDANLSTEQISHHQKQTDECEVKQKSQSD